MTATAFVLGTLGVLAGWVTDSGPVMIFSFWIVLIAFALLLGRDADNNAAAQAHEERLLLMGRESVPGPETTPDYFIPVTTVIRDADWQTLDDIYAWPTAAPGTYPEAER